MIFILRNVETNMGEIYRVFQVRFCQHIWNVIFELEEILEYTMDRFVFAFEMMNEKAVQATSNQLYSSYLAFNDNHLFQATFYWFLSIYIGSDWFTINFSKWLSLVHMQYVRASINISKIVINDNSNLSDFCYQFITCWIVLDFRIWIHTTLYKQIINTMYSKITYTSINTGIMF